MPHKQINQGAHTVAGGLKSQQGAEPPWPPHFIHCIQMPY